jgi:hypothetical protein
MKITKSDFLKTVKVGHFSTKNVLGYILGDFFSQTHLVTLDCDEDVSCGPMWSDGFSLFCRQPDYRPSNFLH